MWILQVIFHVQCGARIGPLQTGRRDRGTMKHARQDVLSRADRVLNDLSFGYVSEWIEAGPGRHAIGYLPMYVPREIIAAAGMLPVACSAQATPWIS